MVKNKKLTGNKIVGNIKLDIINIIDDILYEKKYSNIQLNYYFSKKNYTKRKKLLLQVL